MRQIRTSTAAAIAGLATLALLATPSFAGGNHGAMNPGAPVQTAPMGQYQGNQWRGQSGTQGMMQPGCGGPQQGGPGTGMGGQGMMAPGTGGQGMLAPGMSGQGMLGQGFGKGPSLDSQVVPSKGLTADDVRQFLEHRLEIQGNKRLKVGEVKQANGDTIVADITTLDGSLVQRLEVNRRSGNMQHVE